MRIADDALAGRIELDGFRFLARGGIELRGVRVIDPDGDLVLSVDRARVYVDVGQLRSKVIGARLELDNPSVILKREEDGALSLARAFAPTHPKPKKDEGPFDWTVRLTRLVLRGGAVRYIDAAGAIALAVERVDIDARGAYGPRGARLELRLGGAMTAPEAAPISLEVAGGLRGTLVRARQLRAAVGDTALDLAGEFDWVSWKGRAALLALAVDAKAVSGLAPRAPLAGDLAGTLYAESDGVEATAALDLHPDRGRAGAARAAAALRLPPQAQALALGLDVAADGLDLGRVLRGVPATSLTLSARGRGQGKDLPSLRGALSLSLAPSRVRGARLGPAELRATADRGRIDVSRLEAALPGATLRGRGAWRSGGAIEAHLAAEGRDLAALRAGLSQLLARPLPAMAGSAHVEADVGGTEAAPTAAVRASSPSLVAAGVAAHGLALSADLAGPLSAPRAQLQGAADRVIAGELELERPRIDGKVAGRGGDVKIAAAVPRLGPEPLTVAGAGSLSQDGHLLAVNAIALSWPGDRFELAAPARVDLRGPSVDRLALASGRQRITVEGGIAGAGRRRGLALRASLENLELAPLPLRALVPQRFAPAGRVSLVASAEGPAASPRASVHVELADGAVAGVTGLTAAADLGYDGKARRATLDLGARRVGGGEIEAKADLPISPARAPDAAPLSLRLAVRGVPVADALALAGAELPLQGVAAVEISVGGTAGKPEIAARATLDAGRYLERGPFTLDARLDDAGDEARLIASADWLGTRAADVEVRAPLATAVLLRDPARVVRGLAEAQLRAAAEVPGLDLATLAGSFGLPEDLGGRLTARADLTGTARAPRGTVKLAVADGAVAGYRTLALEASLHASDGATELTARAGLQGEEVARLEGALRAAPERLRERRALDATPLTAALEVRRADLRHAGATVPLAGEISGKVEASGNLAYPRLTVDLAGHKVEISGHPLGELTVKARSAEALMHGELHLEVASGGRLDGALDVAGELGLETLRRGEIARAPAKARLVASELDLGVLPAFAPGRIRSASGKLGADIVAVGPLARLSPKGTLALAGGRVSVAEYGEWRDIELSASLSEDAFKLDRLAGRAQKGGGRVEAKGQAIGLARSGKAADVSGELHADGLTIPRGGQDLATITVDARLKGTASRDALDTELSIARAVVKLPDRTPRKIQPLDDRQDIVVGSFEKKARPPPDAGSAPAAKPYRAKVHLLVPNQFWVKSDSPRVDAELKADLTAEYRDAQLTLLGDVETLRGQVEPIPGRNFEVKTARVHFVGSGDPKDATLEVEALYTNPSAKVTVSITGSIGVPEIKLSSDPPMDEGQIALLIATGRTELKASSGGATFNEQAASSAAATAASVYFTSLVANKLPVDSVQVDASQLRAGKYLTDKLYVGYTYSRNAKPEQGENTNEVRLEFQITPRWTLEGRAGDAGTGGGSLIWSKDY